MRLPEERSVWNGYERACTTGKLYFETTTGVELEKESVFGAMRDGSRRDGKEVRLTGQNNQAIPVGTKIVPSMWVLAKKRRHRQARHQRRNWSPSKSRERPLVNLLCSHHTVPSGAEMPYPIGIGGQEKGLGLRVDIRNVHLNRRARRIRWRQLTASHGTTDATACGEACIAEVLKKVGLLQSK